MSHIHFLSRTNIVSSIIPSRWNNHSIMTEQSFHHDGMICTNRCIGLLILALTALPLYVRAQTSERIDTLAPMTVWECIDYAVAHSHGLRQRALQLDNSEATRMQAAGAFLPSLGASAGTQWNFGRAIDPETNTYTSVSTFNNGYGLSTSLPVFDGLSRLHTLRAARADVLMQKNALQADRDQVALDTYQAFTNVVYYQETVRLAEEKLHESKLLLRQTEVMEEEGLKSPADVALIRAQVEADKLTLTRQENQRESGMLKLKEVMNWEVNDELRMTNDELRMTNDESMITLTKENQPNSSLAIRHSALLLQSYYHMESTRHALGAARSNFYPTVYLNAGVNTSYFRNLSATHTTAYGQQLKNNLGEYVSLSLSIPLFNRLGNIAALRRAKNNVRIAEEQYAAKRMELEVLRQQAHLDVKAYQQECVQGTAKVAADSLAYELTRQQYTQGLASPIDLQAQATTLLQSRASLLQSRLMVGVKEMMVRYYEGEPLDPR
ncbi:MAG: TolC family protein [Bacteroidaceae bacterium]|nr:TolC family protein [Bacteroidaceae bacterium]